MGSVVIVAIPDENDLTWKVSSEKVPHLTLLFLGEESEVSNLDQIMQFVEHAANTSLNRFYLPVDRRGELGDAKADVLFFKKGRYDFKAVRDFRSMLLKDPNIKSAYDATSQFETPENVGAPGQAWIPHLTLGYPDTPAKPIPDGHMSTIYDVSFDRLAIWTDDFEGPEFVLKDYWEEFELMEVAPMDVAMSDIRSNGNGLLHVSEKPWSDFKQSDYSIEQWHAACLIHTHEGDPTAKSECKLPVKTPDGALNRNGVHAAAAALAGARGGLKDVSEDQKKKAASALKRYYGELDEEPPESLTQAAMTETADLGADFLTHYGTKGMKWGVRKLDGAPEGSHIRINQKTNQAAVSKASTAAILAPVLLMPPLTPLAFLSPRVRAEVKAARAQNKLVQGDKKFKKAIDKSKKGVEVHNKAADEINSKIGGFNADKRWKNADGKDIDLTKDPAKKKEYDDAVTKEIINPAYSRAAVSVYGSKSPSGRYTFEIKDDSTGLLKFEDTLKTKRVEHADGDEDPAEMTVEFKINRNATGHILGMTAEDDDSVEHAINLGANFLEHYGVKGMRWGVRRDDISRAAESSSSRLGAAVREADRFSRDVEFEANTRGVLDPNTRLEGTSKAKQEVEAKGYENFRKQDLPAIKKKPEYVKASKLRNRLLHPRDSATKAYRKEVKEAYIKRLEEAANSMKNASGTRQYTIREEGGSLPGSKYSWEVSTREVKHGAIEDHTFTVEVIMDEDGFITDLKKTGDVLAQSMDFGSVLISDLLVDDDSVEHYGVKGMRWGVRKSREARSDKEEARREKRPAQDVAALPSIGRSSKTKARVLTEGGEDHPPSEDAIKVAMVKQKLKKSGTAALSNKELQELQNRLNLERNVAQLTPVGTAARGRKFVKGLTGLNKEANEFGRSALNTRNILREARG